MEISTFVDIGIVVILLISIAVSFYRGLIREVLTIFGVLGGVLAAIMFGPLLRPYTHQWFGVIEGKEPEKLFDLIPANIAADATAYFIVFVAVFLALQLASYFLSSSAHAIGLGPIDRTLGVLFGIVRGVFLLGLIYLPFHLILSDDNKKDWFEHSKTIPYIEKVTLWMLSYLPTDHPEEDKERQKDARQKLLELDLLGDKRIKPPEKMSEKTGEKIGEENGSDPKDSSPDQQGKEDQGSPTSSPEKGAKSPEAADGYQNNERKGLDRLIKDMKDISVEPQAGEEADGREGINSAPKNPYQDQKQNLEEPLEPPLEPYGNNPKPYNN